MLVNRIPLESVIIWLHLLMKLVFHLFYNDLKYPEISKLWKTHSTTIKDSDHVIVSSIV
jgi:hypothetical protein